MSKNSNTVLSLLTELKRSLPQLETLSSADKTLDFQHDEGAASRGLECPVAFPKSTQDVQTICQKATAFGVKMIPRGAGSGLSGACVPLQNALIVSLEKMNRILEVDEDNFTVTVEPGVITGDIRNAVEDKGLFYPPVPASVDFCTIGGNVATNAGGLCAVKYGVTREFVLGLKAVTPDGSLIESGGKLMKCSTGYDLTQLITGSEGTLAIITEIILKLVPLPKHRATLLIPFASLEEVSECVVNIVRNKLTPPTLELLPKGAVDCVLNLHEMSYPFPQEAATLLIELDAFNESELENQVLLLVEATQKYASDDPIMAQSESQRNEMWELRKKVRDSIVAAGSYVEADSVVPRNRIPDLIASSQRVAQKHKVRCICYGHAGDGNLHTYFQQGEHSDADWIILKDKILHDFFTDTVELGGNISGEHGIGFLKKDYLPLAYSNAELELMKRLKKAFDPKGLLNPDKVLPGHFSADSEKN